VRRAARTGSSLIWCIHAAEVIWQAAKIPAEPPRRKPLEGSKKH